MSAEGINLGRPGAFTEGFKQVLAARAAVGTPAQEVGDSELHAAGASLATKVSAQAQPEPVIRVKPSLRKDLPELRMTLIGILSRDRGILASGIEKSLPWEWADPSDGGKVLIPVRDTLTAELLKKEYPLIRQILGELWGGTPDKALELEVVVSPDGAEDADKEPELPPQVAMVQRMFRGTVVKIGSMEKKDAN